MLGRLKDDRREIYVSASYGVPGGRALHGVRRLRGGQVRLDAPHRRHGHDRRRLRAGHAADVDQLQLDRAAIKDRNWAYGHRGRLAGDRTSSRSRPRRSTTRPTARRPRARRTAVPASVVRPRADRDLGRLEAHLVQHQGGLRAQQVLVVHRRLRLREVRLQGLAVRRLPLHDPRGHATRTATSTASTPTRSTRPTSSTGWRPTASEPARDHAAPARRVCRLRRGSRRASSRSSRALRPKSAGTIRARACASVLVNGLLQSRMVRGEWKPGLMHAVIFLGFLALLARKLQLFAIGYDESVAFPGLAGGLFAAFKDGVEAAVLARVRLRALPPLRPEARAPGAQPRGAAGPRAHRGDHAHRLRLRRASASRCCRRADPAIAHERAFAFIGDALASAPVGAAARRRSRPATGSRYWTQMVVVLSFLVILPLGEHFHIVTALPALFFRRGRPANAVPTVDLEKAMSGDDESAMRVGRAHRPRPHLEGGPGRVHLHRVRPLQGRLPHVPHRQAAVAQVGQRQPEAPPAGAAARRSSSGKERGAAARSFPA